MSAATILTNDVLAGPVLIFHPGLQGQVIESGHRDYEQACRLLGLTGGSAPVAQCNLTILTGAAAVELLDVADATWEDAEWQ